MREGDDRPFARERLARRAAPFALSMLLAFAVLPLGPSGIRPVPAIAAAVLALAIAAAAVLAPWRRLPERLEAAPPLAWFGVILLLRESQGAGLLGYGPLLLLPVLWLLLYGSRREAGYAIAGIAVTLIASAELDGGGASLTDLRLVIVWTAVASTVCVAVLRLVAEVRRQAAELERLASTDSLTGLPNRRVWEDALPRELARSQRAGTPVAIALLDLDHFKTYNDHNGHQGGDLLLKEAAAAWPVELRESDLLARHGDEEFALLLPDCGTADAADVVEKVRRATPAEATSSAGVAVWNGIETADQLIRRAGEALSEAKRSGRDRTVVAHGGGPRPEPAGA